MIRLSQRNEQAGQARRKIWEQFRNNSALIKAYNITPEELEELRTAAMLGNLKSMRDFIFILNTKRGAFHKT